MIWGAIGVNRRICVMFQNVDSGLGNGVNADRYIDQVLRPHVVSYFLRHPNHVFHEDSTTTLYKPDYVTLIHRTFLDFGMFSIGNLTSSFPQNSDSSPQTADLRQQPSDSRPQTADLRQQPDL